MKPSNSQSLESPPIRRVAVLGAGVMGAQIAAHFANAGLEVVLFDLPGEGGTAAARRLPIEQAIERLKKQKPAPLASPRLLTFIMSANYQDDLQQIENCDLVIEAIAENSGWKIELYQKVLPYLRKDAILASNTSSIPIAQLASALPNERQSHFLGIHFFNPPRYMRLLEMIAHTGTQATVLDKLEGFFTNTLGKGVIRAKDSTGFIGNRIGVMAMLIALHHAKRLGLELDLIDELTGTRIGRPKSATFRTMDVVGLDTMAFVVRELHEGLPDDPWRDVLQLPDWITQLIAEGVLGQKTQKGAYQKIKNMKGESEILVYEPDKQNYRPVNKKQIDGALKSALKLAPQASFSELVRLSEKGNKQAAFLVACYLDLFHYCAIQLGQIADNARDLDLALRWGYGWEQGPFESWQAFGWQAVTQYLQQYIESGQSMTETALPDWVTEPDRVGVHEGDASFSATTLSNHPRSTHPVYARQLLPTTIVGYESVTGRTIFEDSTVRYWCLENEVGIISFKTKMHTLNYQLIQSLNHVLDIAEMAQQAVIVYQPDGPFCAGANLYEILMAAKLNKLDGDGGLLAKFKQKTLDIFTDLPPLADDLPSLREVIVDLQALFMRFKHGTLPTVAAVNGLALGGGCELLLHCNHVVATLESYIGLVESGVGILPAGGGSKEMTLRAHELTQQVANPNSLLSIISRYFEQIAMAKVSTSATAAQEMGYLRPQDSIILNPAELLYVAHQQARNLLAVNAPPPRMTAVTVLGETGKSTIHAMLANMLAGGFISAHDEQIALAIADTMTGGEVDGSMPVSQTWLLKLEQQHFIDLIRRKLTQDRMEHMLKTGKPLRN
ncbi:MAG: 3-hydroxyacyl-CoA dehydrogenase/enoyl-CoA hydratase family protein [Ostreibacterium sp.]